MIHDETKLNAISGEQLGMTPNNPALTYECNAAVAHEAMQTACKSYAEHTAAPLLARIAELEEGLETTNKRFHILLFQWMEANLKSEVRINEIDNLEFEGMIIKPHPLLAGKEGGS